MPCGPAAAGVAAGVAAGAVVGFGAGGCPLDEQAGQVLGLHGSFVLGHRWSFRDGVRGEVPSSARSAQKSNRSFFSELESAVVELRQLEYLVAVAEEANFTRAAERVHISQSGISAQIRVERHDRDYGYGYGHGPRR